MRSTSELKHIREWSCGIPLPAAAIAMSLGAYCDAPKTPNSELEYRLCRRMLRMRADYDGVELLRAASIYN